MNNATIYALASGVGRAGVAVVRLSGRNAGQVLQSLTGRDLPPARQATVMDIKSENRNTILDRGLVLWFPGPHSFTGEDTVEFHIHGGRAVLAGLFQAFAGIDQLRPAEPGEFTRRAFEHGKLDLTEAEAIADLVAADTAAQQRQALRQMSGDLGRLYEGWRDRLLRALAHWEAVIDFPDEDLPAGVSAAKREEIATLATEISRHLADAHRGERLREGLSVVILGPPNAGKSSLLNYLARRDVAIVSTLAGTTRDVIEVAIDLGGYPVILADTAGLRWEGTDEVEREGVRRAGMRAKNADLKLVLLETKDWVAPPVEIKAFFGPDSLLLATKCDLSDVPPARETNTIWPVSVQTGQGIEAFLAELEKRVAERLAPGDTPSLTRARHRTALEDCRAALIRFSESRSVELAAEDLRLATRALGRITGRVAVEDMLDILFRDFCIGK